MRIAAIDGSAHSAGIPANVAPATVIESSVSAKSSTCSHHRSRGG